MNTLALLFWISLFIVFYTYLGYGIILYILVKIKEVVVRPIAYDLPVDLPKVTLFITAYNEQDIVAQKMANCSLIDYPKDKLDILWVTDGTTDNTHQLLAEYPQARVSFSPARKGKTAAMNRGIGDVHSSIVVFTDANTLLNDQVIKEIVRCFENPKVGCVAGEKRIAVKTADHAASSGEGIYWKYESFLKDLDDRLYSVVGAAGELFAVRKEQYVQMPDDTLLDDFILSLRIAMNGQKTAYCANAYAVENASLDMVEEQKRKVRIAAGGLQSIYRLAPLLNIFKYGTLSFQYISHRVLRWTVTPIFLFALLPLNIALLFLGDHTGLWAAMLIGQIVFYLAGLFGWLQARNNLKNRFLFVPYYFLFMNINVFKGVRYLRHKKGGAWEKAKRG